MSSAENLEGFLREKSTEYSAADATDWEQRKATWIHHIEELYALVESWLADLKDEGVVSFQRTSFELSEDYLGSYQAQVLHLFVGKQKVSLYPKGTLIVGASGRVDLWGQHDSRILILADGQWSILLRKSPKIETIPFDPDSFSVALQEVMA